VSLLGPSGCGKTTTLRCIAGFEQPDQGRISINGEMVANAATQTFVPPNRRNFGMVFQSYAIWPHMTVFNNVAYPLKVQRRHSRDDIRRLVKEKLRIVGLDGYDDRYPNQLSGGQQQRVALARALVMGPKLLLFDEPLSNLDAKLRERMRFELTEIQKQLGIPAVYVTHDQAEAMVMSDRVIVMESGLVAQEGVPREVYARPTTRFVADFIGLSNFVPATVEERAGDGTWITSGPLGRQHCLGTGTLSPSASVLLAVRPERIELASEPFESAPMFDAKISRVYFVGPYTEYFLDLAGHTIRAQSSTLIDAGVGQTIYGRVKPEYCQILAQPAGKAMEAAAA
jgi:iron(III) transport system ATP-binding protein